MSGEQISHDVAEPSILSISLILFPYLTTISYLFSEFIDDFLASGRNELDQFPQLEFEQLPFSHPLFIMYSSGTTGAPKCMVHSAGVRNTVASTQYLITVSLKVMVRCRPGVFCFSFQSTTF